MFEKWINKLFLKLDFLSPNVQMRIKGRPSVNTYFGGIYSLIAIVVLFIFGWLFGKDMIYKEKPFLITLNTLTDWMPSYEMNFNTTFFAFRVEYNNGSVIKNLLESYSFTATINTYLKPKIKGHSSEENSYSSYSQDIAIQSCSYYRKTSYSNALIDYEWDNLLCLDPSVNFELGGIWGSNLTIVEIIIDYCQNSTYNNLCLSKEKIIENTDNLYFSIYYFDNVVDPTIYDNPFKKRISNMYTLIDCFIFKNTEFFYHSVDVVTDNGFFVESITNSSSLQYHLMASDVSTNNNDQSGLIQFDYYLNNYRSIIKRKYIKIQEVFAQLGGLIQILIIFGNVLLMFIRDLKTNSYIMNQLFDFTSIKYINDQIDSNPKEILEPENRKKKISEIIENRKESIARERKSLFSSNNNSPLRRAEEKDKMGSSSSNNVIIFEKPVETYDIITIKNKDKQSKYEEEIKEIFKSINKEREFKYSLSEEFSVSFCLDRCKSEKNLIKYSLYLLIKEEVEKYLNIDYLAKKIQEIEYLKFLLFSPEQIKCFHFFQKAEVCLDINKAKKQFSKVCSESRNLDNEYFYSIINYFSTINKEELLEGKTVDAKLHELLNEEIQEIILPK